MVIMLQLLIISLILFDVMDNIYVPIRNYFSPSVLNTVNTYTITIGQVPEGAWYKEGVSPRTNARQ